jgi:hypothetical protein
MKHSGGISASPRICGRSIPSMDTGKDSGQKLMDLATCGITLFDLSMILDSIPRAHYTHAYSPLLWKSFLP